MIDYTKEDFTRAGQRYDVTYDTVGNHSMRELRRRPESEGPGDHDQKLIVFLAEVRQDDLNLMRELIDSGKVKPVVDRTYPLSQTADAIRYLEQGHARGKGRHQPRGRRCQAAARPMKAELSGRSRASSARCRRAH